MKGKEIRILSKFSLIINRLITPPKDWFTRNLRCVLFLNDCGKFLWEIEEVYASVPPCLQHNVRQILSEAYMERRKHQQAGPHFVPEPADHKMFHQDLGTCYEPTGTGTDKCLMPGQAIIPLFNLKTQGHPISLFSINRWYSGCPHTEWEMKLYRLQRFLRLLPPPHCMRRVLRGQRDIAFMRPSHGRAPVAALMMATAGKWADGY